MASILAQRLASEPAFAEKFLAARRNRDPNDATWVDEAADGWSKQKDEARSETAAEGAEIGDDHDLDKHARFDEIRVVAQALAFRPALAEDAVELTRLVHAAYSGENAGQPEGFRTSPIVDLETVELMIADPECRWIVAEVPNGRSVVTDGSILGCCCYSVGQAAAATTERGGAIGGSEPPCGGVSRERLATIRLLGCLPAFLGLYVGRRLLQRLERILGEGHDWTEAESEAGKAETADTAEVSEVPRQAPPLTTRRGPNAARPGESRTTTTLTAVTTRILCCVPALRTSVLGWAHARGFKPVGTAAIPGAATAGFSRPTHLVVVEKRMSSQDTRSSNRTQPAYTSEMEEGGSTPHLEGGPSSVSDRTQPSKKEHDASCVD